MLTTKMVVSLWAGLLLMGAGVAVFIFGVLAAIAMLLDEERR